MTGLSSSPSSPPTSAILSYQQPFASLQCLGSSPASLHCKQPHLQSRQPGSADQEGHKEQQAVKPLTWPPVLSSLPPLDQPSTGYLCPILCSPGQTGTERVPASAPCPCEAPPGSGPHTDLPLMPRAGHVFPGTAHYEQAHIKADFWHARTGNNARGSFSSPPGRRRADLHQLKP